MSETATITKSELVARAEALIPVLAERALATEQAGRVLPETIDDLINAGLMRIGTPARWGGQGLDYDTVWEVGATLGQGCGSTAWCFMVSSVHSWQMGLAPEEAQQEFYTTPDQISSSGPPGKCESVDGGWTVQGRWPFSSGVDNAQWLLPMAFTREYGMVSLLIPKADARVVDDWDVAGLRGTGSKSVVFDEPTFVPAHRYMPFSGAGSPEAHAAHGRALYGAPLLSVIAHTLAAPLVGMAQGMVDEFAERMKSRRSSSGTSQTDSVGQQLRIAEASAMVDAAWSIGRTNLAELTERGAQDDTFTDLDRARFRRDHWFMGKLSVMAANRLFEGAGGGSLYSSDPLQRFHRDIHAGSHQIALDPDVVGELYGRARFGLELAPGTW